MRKLASVRKIKEIKPIKNADNLELAIIDGWQAVVKKGEYKLNDKIIYCEIDSFLPIKPEYEFLRKCCYKNIGNSEGFRIKSMKLRGELSQGLVLPITSIKDGLDRPIGQDVSNELEIAKYEQPIPAQMQGIALGTFPSFIQKTDEERIQNLADRLDDWALKPFHVTEKLDGTSCTIYEYDGRCGVCSRNMELAYDENNLYWKAALKYDIINKLKDTGLTSIAIQGEIIGHGIQSNPYKFPINEIEFRVFNIFDIKDQHYVSKSEVCVICNYLGLLKVPTVYTITNVPNNLEEVLKMADGKSLIHNQVNREGLVFVCDANENRGRISFKVISNQYLLNNEE